MMKKLFFTLFGLLCIANTIHSQEISSDKSFGQNGNLIIPNVGIEFVDFDTQGNIFVIGSNEGIPKISKTNANGVIDQTFGTNGTVTLEVGTIYGIKATGDNKIVLVLSETACTVTNCGSPKHIITRLNEDGTVDESFGNNGEIILENMIIRSVNTESDEFMLITYGITHSSNSVYYISKYNYSSKMDMTFGTEGKVTLDFPINFSPDNIKVLSDNSIIVAGFESGFILYSVLLKLDEQGNIVTSFANNGRLALNEPNEGVSFSKPFIIEESNGDLLFSGYNAEQHFVRSFNSNGESNNNFNSNFGEESYFYYSETLNTIGNALLNGNYLFMVNNEEIIIRKIDSAGTLDNNFAGNMTFEGFTVKEMFRQSSDKIIVLGKGTSNGQTIAENMFIRLNVSGATPIKPKEIKNSFSIFPNIVNGMLKIESGNLKINQIEIVDLSGKTIYNLNNSGNQVNVSALPNGNYFVKAKTNKGVVTSKFVKR